MIHRPTTTNTVLSNCSHAPPVLATAASICFVTIFPNAQPSGHNSMLINVKNYRIPILLVPVNIHRPIKTGAAAIVINNKNCCNNCISQ